MVVFDFLALNKLGDSTRCKTRDFGSTSVVESVYKKVTARGRENCPLSTLFMAGNKKSFTLRLREHCCRHKSPIFFSRHTYKEEEEKR